MPQHLDEKAVAEPILGSVAEKETRQSLLVAPLFEVDLRGDAPALTRG
jgi:hypothetical protein